MPNYGLVVTPTYNPMSYEQYIQPFKDYAQVYNATVDQIDALEMEANQWERLADSDIDAPQYQQYKSYADDLRKYANEIATQGLSSRTRAGLSRMRQRYAKEIKPIEDAFNYRQKMAEEQRKLNPKGDMQWDVDFSNVGLGAIMANPSMGYSGRSLSEMEQEGFEQAKAASSRKLITQKAKSMGNQYYQILQGYGKEAAAAFLQQAKSENPTEYQELVNLYNQIRESYGTTAEDSPYSTDQNAMADDRILNGMMKGLALQDSYQTNHWALPGANRNPGSGEGDADVPKPIGYEVAVKDANGNDVTFTTVLKADGTKEYYSEDGVPVTDNKTLEVLNASTPYARYYLRNHKDNKDMVDVVDARNNFMPVTQNNKIISFNKNTHDWNAVNRNIVSKGASINKIFSYQTDGTKRYFDKIEDAYKASSRILKKGSTIKNATDIVLGDTRESATNPAYKIIRDNLPPEVIENPQNYIIQFSEKGNDKVSFIVIDKKFQNLIQTE